MSVGASEVPIKEGLPLLSWLAFFPLDFFFRPVGGAGMEPLTLKKFVDVTTFLMSSSYIFRTVQCPDFDFVKSSRDLLVKHKKQMQETFYGQTFCLSERS